MSLHIYSAPKQMFQTILLRLNHYIYIYIYVYIYIYIYRHTHTHTLTYVYLQAYRYSDFYVNLHLKCCVPSSSMEGFFSKKNYQKSFSWERFLGKIYGEGYIEGLMIRSYQGRGSKMHFPIICKAINCKSFLQPC